ncbi:glycosyl transferase [Haloarcula vallismortis ATCC 29715]|uniref:Glycosyl transferase n=1 Tax=Haloarcula vallismortis ATCC 29715 TaxID=662477 RepID=M0JAA4_HALVA|nr:glycosyl transferase [Haloarcula vallismortis ATCC 29715]
MEQTYDSIELIVVDDHSPRPAGPVVQQFDDSGIDIRYIRHSENRGANAARNTAIRATNGEYVAFLDDDDQWKPTKVEKQVRAFQDTDDDVGVVYTGMECVDSTGNRVYSRMSQSQGDATTDIFLGVPLTPFSCVMVRSDIIQKAGLLDVEMPSWQDREWYIRLSQHCQFEVISELLVLRELGEHEQIGDDFESKRDISYPLFLSKHRETAAEHGSYYERRFISSLSETLARSAIANNYYTDAIKYSIKSIYFYPKQVRPYLYLLASLGGDLTYKPATKLYRMISRANQH